MPPAVTQTSVIEKFQYTYCTGSQLSSQIEEKYQDIKEDAYKLNPYDMVLSKNESKFLSRVRKWEKKMGFVTPIRWKQTLLIMLFHIVSTTSFLYTTCFISAPMWQTVMFALLIGNVAGFGVTAGAHRYWCHRSYKAKWPLQLILILCYSMAGQNSIYNWVRDHRVHHKFSETTADPHDARRGFFFSHVGWLMMKKHPDVIKEGSKIDMSDISNDPLVRFHTRYINVFKTACCFVLPTLVPVAAWGECWTWAILSQPLVRYMTSLNFTWSVNSFAHLYGNKPYDRHIMPAENWGVSAIALGEGWHNYHHTFPWDYKAAELSHSLNVTTTILDMFASIGWAYELKEASPALVHAVAKNRGDGNKIISSHSK